MHPLKATKAKEVNLYTAECAHEAIILMAYCESRWPVGPSTYRRLSVTGEEYTVLADSGYPSIEMARLGAQAAFDAYALGKTGVLYWRIVPELIFSDRNKCAAFYMRLLISDKSRTS